MTALTLHVEGTFDVGAAVRLAERMLDAPADAELHVDFSHVREFRDSAVPVLCRTLGQIGARVSVEGLTQHQYRLLRYCGATQEVART